MLDVVNIKWCKVHLEFADESHAKHMTSAENCRGGTKATREAVKVAVAKFHVENDMKIIK